MNRVETNNSSARAAWRIGALIALTMATMLLAASTTQAAGAKWRIDSISNTAAAPGSSFEYIVEAFNVGDVPTSGEVEMTAQLPVGMSAVSASVRVLNFSEYVTFECTAGDGSPVGSPSDPRNVKCTNSWVLPPFGTKESRDDLLLKAQVDPGASGTLVPSFEVSGGSAGSAATVDPTQITAGSVGFGIDGVDNQIRDASGEPFTQAGGHPADVTTPIDLNAVTKPSVGPLYPAGPVRDIVADLPPGLIGNPTPLGHCTLGQLANSEFIGAKPLCPVASQVGTVLIRFNGLNGDAGFDFTDVQGPVPLFNMEPPPGSAARFGFNFLGTPVALDARLRFDGEYAISVDSSQITEALALKGVTTTFWGVPSDPIHDTERACPGKEAPYAGGPTCLAASGDQTPFLRTSTACTGPLPFSLHTDSWDSPGAVDPFGSPDLSDLSWKSTSFVSHQLPGFPAPQSEWGPPVGNTGCAKVPVKGTLLAKPTAIETETPSGLNVAVEVPNQGLENGRGISSSDIKGVKVTLPQGVTLNPSQAEGLGTCSPAQYESSRLSFHSDPGHGCPDDSKIGTVNVQTPLLTETIPGNVFVAKPYENPFSSLLAIYIVLAEPQRGIIVKLAGRVEPNQKTGQIVTTFNDLPQLPFSKFEFKFREGARAPLVTPPTCGTYTTEAVFTPWSDPANTMRTESDFEIVHGIGGGPCPPGGLPPFHPGFEAGSINNNAKSYSPFNMRLIRNDGEQDMTKFSAILPPGVLGKLAGVSKCPDAAIAIAKAKTGKQEIASPSCPANSQIGEIKAGAGVGSVFTYVGGKAYLGGAYHGDPLSVVVITPAVAGPFDVGTVVTQVALTLNPETAEVEVDGAASDPIPHILEGIPLKVRDIRVYIDRHDFILNPTSCDPSSAKATLFGSYLDVFDPSDDVPVGLSTRYQAANCLNLGFKPRLSLQLKGGTRRGAHPALHAVLNAREADANIGKAVVTLPNSAFLDQAHIRTICTRVQFAARACPKGSEYGYAKAWTPLLDEPVEGPVYLRSSNHKLPDLVAALHGLVDVNVVGRIDSFKGGIRSSFETVPDAPVSKFVLDMQGAKKGLVVNSRNLCARKARANAQFTGQNGKLDSFHPVVKASCGGKRK
jgi:uncharacterized repeat protein (TIGR01451 family)